MIRVYRTASDAKGHFSYPEYLREREIVRVIITSADATPYINLETAGKGFRPLDLLHGGYRTRSEFHRDADAWRVSFDLLPTADLLAADGSDDATTITWPSCSWPCCSKPCFHATAGLTA